MFANSALPCIALIPQFPFDKLRPSVCQQWAKGSKTFNVFLPKWGGRFRERAQTDS